jgi:hypothetical protein
MLILGIAGLVWKGRRKFYRRNAAGIEEFKSYGGALVTAWLEKTVGIVSWILIFVGFVAMASNAANTAKNLPQPTQSQQKPAPRQ